MNYRSDRFTVSLPQGFPGVLRQRLQFLVFDDSSGYGCGLCRYSCFLHLKHIYTYTETHTQSLSICSLEYTDWHFHGDLALVGYFDYENGPGFWPKRDHREVSELKIKNKNTIKPVNDHLLLECLCVTSTFAEQDSLPKAGYTLENKS